MNPVTVQINSHENTRPNNSEENTTDLNVLVSEIIQNSSIAEELVGQELDNNNKVMILNRDEDQNLESDSKGENTAKKIKRAVINEDIYNKIKLGLEENEPVLNICKSLNVSKSTVYTIKQNIEDGLQFKRKRRGRKERGDDERIKKIHGLLLENPTLTQLEIRDKLNLNISVRSVSNLIKKANLSRKRVKKINLNLNDCVIKDRKKKYLSRVLTLNDENLIFFGEIGFNRNTIDRFGYWPNDASNETLVPSNKGKNVTLMAAISTSGILAYSIFNCLCDHKLFSEFLLKDLYPKIQNNHYKIIMDDCSLYNSVINTTQALKTQEILFLPPFSQELNPIEDLFNEIKQKYKRMKPLCDDSSEITNRINLIVEESFVDKNLMSYYQRVRENVWNMCKEL